METPDAPVVVPEMLPPNIGMEPVVESPQAGPTEFFTPTVMIIIAAIGFVLLMLLWTGGAIADQDTHERITGNSVTLPEAMFNDLATPAPPKD